MNLIVVINCFDCQHYNRQEAGTKDFVMKEYKFTAFSDAHKHILDNPDHYMDIEIQQEQEQ